MDSLYADAVALVFTVSNALKALAYLPTIQTLLRLRQPASGQSELTWLMWIVCNVSLTLHLYEVNGRVLNVLIGSTVVSAAMCLLCWLLIRRANGRYGSRRTKHAQAHDDDQAYEPVQAQR
jgi:hypothetical protein